MGGRGRSLVPPKAARGRLTMIEANLDAVADHERDSPKTNLKLKAPHRPPASEKGDPGSPLKGNDRRAARLATRRPDLAEVAG
jgi:hypothetical protein